MNRSVVIGSLGAVLIVLALGLSYWLNTGDPAPVTDGSDATSEETTSQPEPTTAPKAASVENVDTPAEVKPEESTAGIQTPEFDVVRVSEEGDTVIAGRAPSGSTVTVMDGDKQIGTVTADERGEWVLLPNEPLTSGNKQLSLKAETKDGQQIESRNVVVLAVPETAEGQAAPAGSTKPLAVLVPKSGNGASRVLQKPTEEGGVSSKVGGLVLDSVDYDDDGNMTLGGRGQPNAEVQVYLDNAPIGRTTVVESGNWQLQPDRTVAPGVYKLRIDQVADQKMIGRIELPFSRAEPLKDFVGDAFVIVQPGNSLWRIARRTLGDGINYTVIYEANQEQIRDPDLIYPGQVFEIPGN